MLCVLMCPVLYAACSSGDDSNDAKQENTSTNGGDQNGDVGDVGGGGGGKDAGTAKDSGGGGGTPKDAGGGGTKDAGGGGSKDLEQICVDKINEYRATKGLPAYARWAEAEACTDGQAKSDSETGQAHGAFGKCQEMAQDECPGWSGPPADMIGKCLQMMWDEGPGGGHYENMASKKYTKAACGFFTMTNGNVWAVQNFR
jgi:hypothetical protein